MRSCWPIPSPWPKPPGSPPIPLSRDRRRSSVRAGATPRAWTCPTSRWSPRWSSRWRRPGPPRRGRRPSSTADRARARNARCWTRRSADPSARWPRRMRRRCARRSPSPPRCSRIGTRAAPKPGPGCSSASRIFWSATGRTSWRSPCARPARRSPTPWARCARRPTSAVTTRTRRADTPGRSSCPDPRVSPTNCGSPDAEWWPASRRGTSRWRSSSAKSPRALPPAMRWSPSPRRRRRSSRRPPSSSRTKRACRRGCCTWSRAVRRSAMRSPPILAWRWSPSPARRRRPGASPAPSWKTKTDRSSR